MGHLSHYYRRGVVISQEPGSDRKVEQKLVRCVHCAFTWVPRHGSGRMRGFCQACFGDLCGRPACVAAGCVHWEKQLDLMEAGIPWERISSDGLPVTVAVPALDLRPVSTAIPPPGG